MFPNEESIWAGRTLLINARTISIMNILSIKIQFYNNLKIWEDINIVQSKGNIFKLILTSMLSLDFFSLWLNDTRIIILSSVPVA